jgi:phytoene synthase
LAAAVATGVVDERFRELMRFQIARARAMFRDGAEGLCWLDGASSRLTASAMGVIYAGILSAIEKNSYDVFSRRARLSAGSKIARLPGAWRLARRKDGGRLPDVF